MTPEKEKIIPMGLTNMKKFKKEIQDAKCKPKRLYTTEEVCIILHFSRVTLHKYIKNKKLNPSKIGGKNLFSGADIDQLVKDSCIY